MGVNDAKKRVAAFFDLDLTITRRDSFRYFLKKQYIPSRPNWRLAPQVLLWGIFRKLRIVSLKSFKEKALVSLVGKNETFIREIGESFLERHLLNIIRAKALERIGWHKEKGHFTFIISSCPDIYILPLAEYLKCDGYECSRLAFKNAIFIGKLEGRDCLGAEKTKRLRTIAENKNFDIESSYAYSDHESDLPLLEWIGNPTVVSPTMKLREVAVERGWKIEEW